MKMRVVGFTALALITIAAFLSIPKSSYSGTMAVHAQSTTIQQAVIIPSLTCNQTGGTDGSGNPLNICSAQASWPASFSSANYAITCTPEVSGNPSGIESAPTPVFVGNKTASGFAVGTGLTVEGSSTPIDCIAVSF